MREKSLRRKHPWVFSGAVQRVQGDPVLGSTVEVFSSGGEWLARGAYSPNSQIRIRIWTFDRKQEVSAEFFERMICRAARLRSDSDLPKISNAYRLINSESDGLPGVIVDRYGAYLVCQFLAAGAFFWRDTIVEILDRTQQCAGILDRSDARNLDKEGLKPGNGLLSGFLPAEPVIISEHNHLFNADLLGGHKTGFYLDQRENRRITGCMAAGKTVLNCFAYTGAFAVYCLKNSAVSVVNVEYSKAAHDAIDANMALNGIRAEKYTNIHGDAFEILRKMRDQKASYDLIVLDPPKFAESRKHLDKAARGYKDINLLAMHLLAPGGHLMTFSCSGLVSRDLFQKIIAGAALDSGRRFQVTRVLSQDSDHPFALNFPEGEYLTGLVCRVA